MNHLLVLLIDDVIILYSVLEEQEGLFLKNILLSSNHCVAALSSSFVKLFPDPTTHVDSVWSSFDLPLGTEFSLGCGNPLCTAPSCSNDKTVYGIDPGLRDNMMLVTVSCPCFIPFTLY